MQGRYIFMLRYWQLCWRYQSGSKTKLVWAYLKICAPSRLTSAAALINFSFLFNICGYVINTGGAGFCRSASNMESSHSQLIFDSAYVNGEWVRGKSGRVFDVLNPATLQVITSVPDMDVVDLEEAILAAHRAFQSWSHTTAKERSVLLRKWYNLIQEQAKELGKTLTLESGKPTEEALAEVAYGNSFVEWYAEEARRVYGEVIPSPVKTKEFVIIKQPLGVVALITPWNFPHAMITRKAAAAIAAGCTCIIKPAEETPLTALALAHLAHKAGIPKGVLNIVTCGKTQVADFGKVICKSLLIAGVSFTGSTEVGKLLYSQCAVSVKRLSLELGGNAAFIIFKYADIDKAVNGALVAKFRNCGQSCVSPNRFLIHEDIHDEFVDKLKNKINREIVIGNPADPNTTTGPLINKAQVDKIEKIVENAISKGAKVHCGGKRAKDIGEQFFQPTILTDIRPSMVCAKEEIFGPIIVCMKFKTEDEAVLIANDTRHGLAGYFYSNDLSQIWRVAERLQVGMVGINESMIFSTEIPFGGIKESGIGREGSRHGIDDFINLKYLCFGKL